MRTSEQTTTLLAALVLARSAFAPITKDATGVVGKDHPYRYADLAGILEAIIPACLANGLVILQSIDAESSSLVTRVAHVSGEWVECVYPLTIAASPQALGSALTYGRRYSIQSLLCLAASDDDGTAAGKEVVTTTRPPRPTKEKPAKVITGEQRAKLWATAKRAGWTTVQFGNYLHKTVGIASSSEVLASQYDDLLTVFGSPYEPIGDHA